MEVAQESGKENEKTRPQDGASCVGDQEGAPGHVVHAGEEGSQDPQQGNKAAEEDDLTAMLAEEVLADFDASLREADVFAVAQKQEIRVVLADPVAQIVTQDGADCSGSNDDPDVEAGVGGGVDRRQDEDGLAGQRNAHALKTNDEGYSPVAVRCDKLLEIFLQGRLHSIASRVVSNSN